MSGWRRAEAGGDLGSPDHNTLATPEPGPVQELRAQEDIYNIYGGEAAVPQPVSHLPLLLLCFLSFRGAICSSCCPKNNYYFLLLLVKATCAPKTKKRKSITPCLFFSEATLVDLAWLSNVVPARATPVQQAQSSCLLLDVVDALLQNWT